MSSRFTFNWTRQYHIPACHRHLSNELCLIKNLLSVMEARELTLSIPRQWPIYVYIDVGKLAKHRRSKAVQNPKFITSSNFQNIARRTGRMIAKTIRLRCNNGFTTTKTSLYQCNGPQHYKNFKNLESVYDAPAAQTVAYIGRTILYCRQ